VAYAIVTGLLAGIYAGLVLLATQVFGLRTPVAVAASTLAAALFNPLRRPDCGGVRGTAERCRRPGRGPGRPGQRRAAALEPAHISMWMSERR